LRYDADEVDSRDNVTYIGQRHDTLLFNSVNEMVVTATVLMDTEVDWPGL